MNLTTKQVAKRLGVSVGTVTKWGHEGKLKKLDAMKGNSYVYDIQDTVAEVKKTYNTVLTPTTRLERIEKKLDQLLRMWS